MRRLVIVGVFALFLLPTVVAVLMHSQWFDWRPDATRNHGELLEPAVPLPEFELADAAGDPLTRDDLFDHWQLLHYTGPDAGCDKNCRETLHWLGQVRQAQGRHRAKVEMLLVTPEPVDEATRQALAQSEVPIRILAGDSGRAFAAHLPFDSAADYILDPRAHIILRYPGDSDFNGMRRDLGRLLTWTRSE